MKNEVLCKLHCHNICCVVGSQIELGIEPIFWSDESAESPGRLSLAGLG
jgi:hypothetical protein